MAQTVQYSELLVRYIQQPLAIQRGQYGVTTWPHQAMGREYMLGTPILMFAASYSTAFRVQTGLTQHNGNLSGFTHQVAVRVLSLSSSVGTRRSNNGYLGRGYDHAGKYYGPRSTAVMMVSEREEELKAKIAKLRGATAKGEGYERVVGSGADLTEKMEKSQTENQSDWERQQQVCACVHLCSSV